MRFVDRYPLIVTSEKDASRDFWSNHLGFTIAFDSSWFSLLVADDGATSIAFMSPNHPSAPPGPETFSGSGLCFELEVEDAQAVHDVLSGTGLPISYPLTDEPFGQRRFGFTDPSGLWVDVVEQIEPRAGFWDTYMV